MMTRFVAICTGVLLGPMALGSTSAQALTVKECSAKYKAAQSGKTLNGMKWNAFRKAECGTDVSAIPVTTPAAATKPTAAPLPAAAPRAAIATARPSVSPTTPTNAVFPNGVAPKYSTESAGKARMHTCLDQYNANKPNNGNGGLVWIKKGGGYYSECNKHLKG